MNLELRNNLNAALPLRISRAAWADDVLSLGGQEWSLAVNCAWRLVGEGRLLEGWESSSAAEAAEGLVGLDVTGIGPQSEVLPADLRLQLSNHVILEMFSGHHLEPWVLSLPGVVVVASPSDKEWVEGLFGQSAAD